MTTVYPTVPPVAAAFHYPHRLLLVEHLLKAQGDSMPRDAVIEAYRGFGARAFELERLSDFLGGIVWTTGSTVGFVPGARDHVRAVLAGLDRAAHAGFPGRPGVEPLDMGRLLVPPFLWVLPHLNETAGVTAHELGWRLGIVGADCRAGLDQPIAFGRLIEWSGGEVEGWRSPTRWSTFTRTAAGTSVWQALEALAKCVPPHQRTVHSDRRRRAHALR